jgi:allantoin racemase
MDILVLNPNTTSTMTQSIGLQAKRVAASTTRVTARNPSRGPAAIETAADEEESAAQMLALLEETPREAYDAIVVACGGDPGVAEIRQKVGKPVLGIGQAAMLLACMYGDKFSAIVTSVDSKDTIRDLVGHYGLLDRFGDTYATELSVLEIAASPEGAQKIIEDAVRQAIDDGASAVSLTCAAMGELALPLSQKFGLPVIDGVQAAVKLLEAGLVLSGTGAE